MGKPDSMLERICFDPSLLLDGVLLPEIHLILFGEDHFDEQHYKNEIKLMDEAIKRGLDYKLGIEYFDSDQSVFFTECSTKRDRNRLVDEVKSKYRSELILKRIEHAFDNHKAIVPLSLDEFGNYEIDEKQLRLANELNKITGPDSRIIALVGNAHASTGKLIPNLTVPSENSAVILQSKNYVRGIERVFGKERKTFRVNYDFSPDSAETLPNIVTSFR